MSLLRYDLTTNDWVIFAPERAGRPRSPDARDEPAPHPPAHDRACPFCPGNEAATPAPVFTLPGEGAAGWRVRVVPNKYAALRIEEAPTRAEEGPLFRSMGGCGAHEVIVESPRHDVPLARQPVAQVEAVLRVLQLRFNDLLGDPRFQSIVLFKNHGERSGTSLPHPHCQLIATPVVPRLLRLRHQVAADYLDLTGRCLYEVLLEEELRAGERIIAANEDFVAFAPYASRVPYETWLLPRAPHASFGRVEPARLGPLAALLKDVLSWLHEGLDNPDFNLTVNTVTRGDEEKRYFLWHVIIRPRLAMPSGFELGSGMAINIVMPEAAAALLREVRGR